MSGIVGLINLSGAPVDRELLALLTDSMKYRGTDAQATRAEGSIGLGHTLLITDENRVADEFQPCSLDGEIWITADARIDDRSRLVEELEACGVNVLEKDSDAHLILRAYSAWGTDCVKHLLGDFVFAIWDAPRSLLLCARDQLGVKPLYYARVKDHLVISNTLDCVRSHPYVSDRLNDDAVVDFLLRGFNSDMSTTTYADVQRLPPAHRMTWAGGSLRTERYWNLPTDGNIRYKRSSDYVDNFIELFGKAVNDRLRSSRVGVYMSGGLDSTAIAAFAHKLLKKQFSEFDLRAYTVTFEGLIPDQERYYAGLAAEAIGIPIHYNACNEYELFERWGEPEMYMPEPVDNPVITVNSDQNRQIASNSRVALTGWDGDTIFSMSMPPYFSALIRERRFFDVAVELGRVISNGEFSFLNQLRRLKTFTTRRPPALSYPTWMDKRFETKFNSAQKPFRLSNHATGTAAYRAYAIYTLTSSNFSSIFEGYDASATQTPLEVRHPLADLRIINYSLSIPPVPWSIKKHLLRKATRGILPRTVRLRKKTPLTGDPVLSIFRRSGLSGISKADLASEINNYLDVQAALPISADENPDIVWMKLRVVALNLWLRQRRQFS